MKNRRLHLAMLTAAFLTILCSTARAEEQPAPWWDDQDVVEIIACSYAEFGTTDDSLEFGTTIILNRYERLGAWDDLHSYLTSSDFAKRTRKMVEAAAGGQFKAAGETWTITEEDMAIAVNVLRLQKQDRITDADEWDCPRDISWISDSGRAHNRYGSSYQYYGRAYGNAYGKM